MFKCLSHFYCRSWTSFNTQITHGAEFEVINESIQGFLLFAFRCNIKLGDNFNGSVGAGQFTSRTTGTGTPTRFYYPGIAE